MPTNSLFSTGNSSRSQPSGNLRSGPSGKPGSHKVAGRGKTGPHRPKKHTHVLIGTVSHGGAKQLVLPHRIQHRKNYRNNIAGSLLIFHLRCILVSIFIHGSNKIYLGLGIYY